MILITALFSIIAIAGKKKKKPKCDGIYEGTVVNLCEDTMPAQGKKEYEKIWLVKYYANWHSGSKKLQPVVEEIAEILKEEAYYAVGAVDCTVTKNIDFCRKTEKVYNFPVFKALYQGKTKTFKPKSTAAITKDSLLEFIRGFAEKQGSKGGSSKCSKGAFPSGAKDAVIPLCEAHFPNEKSKNSWVIAFYNHVEYEDDIQKLGNRFALDLGNEPPEKSKNAKKVLAQRKRVKNLISKYDLEGVNAKGASKSSEDPLLKVGGVCCNCGDTDEDKAAYAKFCTEKVGGEKWKEETAFVFTDGTKVLQYEGRADVSELVKYGFKQLGLLEKEKAEL